MEIKIQAIHFDATAKLQDFIVKKLAKIEKKSDDVHKAEVILKVVKAEMVQNKEVSVKISVLKEELFAQKIYDTFEEGIDVCVDAILKQLDKYKEKQRAK